MSDLRSPDGTRAAPLCFGCMQFGGTANPLASRRMFDACREVGVNFFDTAHTYTGGASETILGDLVQTDRDALIIATKAAYTGGSGRPNIMRQVEESRQRLRLDTLDLLYLHRWDPTTPLEETFETLTELQSAGIIRYIGVSNYAAWQVMKAQAVAQSLGTSIVAIQPMYSLVKRQAEVELFPMAMSEGLAVAPYSPLASGLLTGKYFRGETGRLTTDKRYAARYGQDWMSETAASFASLAHDIGINPTTLAVAWVAQNPAVTAPIVSARDVDQLFPSLDALKVTLSSEQYEAIEGLSPRPAPATDRLEEAAI